MFTLFANLLLLPIFLVENVIDKDPAEADVHDYLKV